MQLIYIRIKGDCCYELVSSLFIFGKCSRSLFSFDKELFANDIFSILLLNFS